MLPQSNESKNSAIVFSSSDNAWAFKSSRLCDTVAMTRWNKACCFSRPGGPEGSDCAGIGPVEKRPRGGCKTGGGSHELPLVLPLLMPCATICGQGRDGGGGGPGGCGPETAGRGPGGGGGTAIILIGGGAGGCGGGGGPGGPFGVMGWLRINKNLGGGAFTVFALGRTNGGGGPAGSGGGNITCGASATAACPPSMGTAAHWFNCMRKSTKFCTTGSEGGVDAASAASTTANPPLNICGSTG